jgi:hypothetical protein
LFSVVPYVGITRAGSRGHSIRTLAVGISQPDSSPTIFLFYLSQIHSPVNRNLLVSLHVMRGSDSNTLSEVIFISKQPGSSFPAGVHEK